MVLDRLRAELGHTRRVHRGHRRWIELEKRFASTDDKVEQAIVAVQIAERLWLLASRLERSPVARATTNLPDPDELRAQAVDWKVRSEQLFREAAAP